MIGNLGWTGWSGGSISASGQPHVVSFWEYAAFLSNSVGFILIGAHEANQAARLLIPAAGVAVAQGRRLNSFSVRKEAKDHGAGGRIAGRLSPGDKVVITEDTVTRGTSLIEAARVVREFGAEVVQIIAVVDRGGTAAAMAAAEGWPFTAIFTAPDLGFDYEGAV